MCSNWEDLLAFHLNCCAARMLKHFLHFFNTPPPLFPPLLPVIVFIVFVNTSYTGIINGQSIDLDIVGVCFGCKQIWYSACMCTGSCTGYGYTNISETCFFFIFYFLRVLFSTFKHFFILDYFWMYIIISYLDFFNLDSFQILTLTTKYQINRYRIITKYNKI